MVSVERRNRQNIEYHQGNINKIQIIYKAYHNVICNRIEQVYEQIDKDRKKSKQEINRDSRKRHNYFVPTYVFKVIRIDGDRLRPTKSKQNHCDKAYQIDMFCWVNGHSAQVFCCWIAELVGGIGMPPFVEGEREQDRYKASDKLYRVGKKAA